MLQEASQNNIQNQKNTTPDVWDGENIRTPEQERSDWLLKYAGVTDLNNTFANIKRPLGFETTYKAFKAMAEGKAEWQLLMVYGKSGNGKSLCCEAIVIGLYDRGIRASRERWADIVRFTLKASFGRQPGQEPYEQKFDKLRRRRYLIIDDVGMGSTGGNWEWGELEDIIDFRFEKRLFTIVTTNLDLKEIPPRIVSRFRDKSRARLICNEAADQRPLK